MARKRGNKIRVALYFILLLILLTFLILHTFNLVPMQTGFFTRFMISLIVVVLLLPIVPHIKIFDIVDVRRDTRFLSMAKKGSRKNK